MESPAYLYNKMDIIRLNPYRVLGVFANSSARERMANHSRMKAFLKVGKQAPFPLDSAFSFPIERTTQTVDKAEADLTLPKDQMRYAQFWLIKTSPLDDVAFNNLFAGNADKAISIWEKRPNDVSSLQNRIVCSLIKEDYASALSLAETLYADKTDEFVRMVLGDDSSLQAVDVSTTFIDTLCDEVGASVILPYIKNDSWRKHVGEKTISPIMEALQTALETAKQSRDKGSNARLEAGTKLMTTVRPLLIQLKKLLSTSNLQYQMIADKLAQEILQCGIDYYNNTDDKDAPQKAMLLQKYALSIAVGNLVKDRCRENVETLNNVGPEYAVRNELARLMKNIKELRNEGGDSLFRIGRSIYDIQNIVSNCIPDIEIIKKKLGYSTDLYIKVASAVVSSAVNALVEVVNLQQTLSIGNVEKLRPIISSAVSAMNTIGRIDMDEKTRNYYNGNNSTLQSMNSRLNPSDNGACYIATMTYGDYEHPQVIILRHFRDLYLAKRNWGKCFIKTYYKYSPGLVRKLRNHILINKFIRMLLDGFISCIKNKYK